MNKQTLYIVSLIAAGSVLGLSGCGFKSDLSLPESKNRTPLFEPDMLPDSKTQEIPPFLPSSADDASATGAAAGIPVEIATTVATEGQILVSPGDEENEENKGNEAADGVPVDLSELSSDINLTDLTRDPERESNTQ